MDAPTHIVTAPVVLGAHRDGPLPAPDYTAATAAGVRAWADLLGRAAFRLRTPAGSVSALAEAVANLLEQEAESSDRCAGFICPPRPAHEVCRVDEHSGEIDEADNTPAHHHCAWCNAWVRSWEEDEPAAVRLARTVLEKA